jgi:hypothetical protein
MKSFASSISTIFPSLAFGPSHCYAGPKSSVAGRINARVGALERLIHDQCRLHQRVDCLRRPSQSIRN